MVRKTKEDTELTYHALLNAATRLFIQQGIANTTLNDIAQTAGMTRGALYWHFDNKDAVIKALWERNADALHNSFQKELRHLDINDPAGHFRRILYGVIQQVVEEPEIGQAIRIIMHNVEFTDEETELQFYLRKKREVLYNAMEFAFKALKKQGCLSSSLSPKLLSQAVMSYLYGLTHSQLDPGEQTINLKKNGSLLFDLLLDSMLA